MVDGDFAVEARVEKVVGTADAAPDVAGSKVVEMADAVSEDTEINIVGTAVVPFVGLVPDGS